MRIAAGLLCCALLWVAMVGFLPYLAFRLNGWNHSDSLHDALGCAAFVTTLTAGMIAVAVPVALLIVWCLA